MPLHKGAKPGSKKFGENIAAEIRAGKPAKQAEAIAYSEARKKDKAHVRVAKDATGAVHVFLPNSTNYRGLARTLARSFADRKPRRRAKDMPKENFEELKRLLTEFLSEEEREPEHASDCSGKKDCGCGCKH